MEKDFQEKYHRLEKSHWWFRARRDMILRLAKEKKRTISILDMGCSGCPLLRTLKKDGFKNLQGIDSSQEAVRACREQGFDNVSRMSAENTEFPKNSFDLLISSDLLEHIEDDCAALREWNRILKPGGIMIVFVPAFRFLWSRHDEINRHFRRYSRKELMEKLGHSGFSVERASYWNFCLFLPALSLKCIQRLFSKKGSDQLFGLPPLLNTLLLWMLKAENFFLEHLDLPFGVSVFAVARKSTSN
ncbi:methyltransferase domain-containing protein [Candidatus Micrarchaeota archaeon]|nr:methyltransferase domain-containing protein [Candidatus Micrarchaeota archaeon]